MRKSVGIAFFAVCLVACLAARAEVLDRPIGIRIGQRMTLRPYVSMSLTYDSNVSPSSRSKGDDYLWTISPAFSLNYNAESWALLLSGYYNYRQYFKNVYKGYNHHTFGEDLRWNWSNSSAGEKGWSLIIGQAYQQITGADDMMLSNNEKYSNDSRQLQLSGALQRNFNQYWHGDVNASYYWLDYGNDAGSSSTTYYGWERMLVGAEVGFAPSRWTDIILSGSWSHFSQDNVKGSSYDGDSQSCSFQAGLASYMTERISYRVLAGWSQFEYAGGESKDNGFVYTVSANWKIGETWNTMILGSSYYQPSERQFASHSHVDAISWGLTKMMVNGKLRANFDIRYRRETNESAQGSNWDYVLNIWTGRLGLDYTLCRFLSVYAYGEYQTSMNDEAKKRYGSYDYDRWRATVGFRLQY